jgi:hypothetical protein
MSISWFGAAGQRPWGTDVMVVKTGGSEILGTFRERDTIAATRGAYQWSRWTPTAS